MNQATAPARGTIVHRARLTIAFSIRPSGAGGAPTPLPAPPRRYGFADRTLLSILHHRPELARPIFERLFRHSSMDDVLAFLDGDSTVWRDAAMLARLPWAPFLRAGAGELVASVARPGSATIR